MRKSSRGAFRMEDVSNFCPAMAVPMTVKIPDPITAPIPSAVSETGPSVFFSRRSGSSESEIRLSMDLQQKSWLSEVRMETRAVFSDGPDTGSGKRLLSPGSYGFTHQHRPSAGKKFAGHAPIAKCQVLLPLRCAARQLFHFAFLRSARVIPRLQ